MPKKKAAPKRKVAAKKIAPAKKIAAPKGAGDQIGEVVAFFRIPVVAVIKITKGVLKTGTRVWIKGHTTDLKETVSSMQIDHKPVQAIRKGQEAGIKVASRTRRGDRIYLIR